jgi:4a-hydroxytetrahydrobiopterin dehydratase
VEELEAAELAGADLALGRIEQRRLCRVLDGSPPQLPCRHRRQAYRTRVRSRKWREDAGMPPLSDDEVRTGLAKLPGWERRDDEIEKVFELPSFPDAIAFVTRIGFLAEKAEHHPDLDIRWRKVRVALSTHSEGGITEKDFALAGEIEAVAGGSSS